MRDYWIILIDDDEDDALLLKHFILHKPRIKFDFYIDPVLFLADLQAGTCQPDLIIVDFRLPNYSGLDVIKFARFYRQDYLPKLILWSSSQITEQELEKCSELQAIFVEKGPQSYVLIAQAILEGKAN